MLQRRKKKLNAIDHSSGFILITSICQLNCFAFRPQPALPRKLDSVNLVPRGYFRLYKRPRGIRQRKD